MPITVVTLANLINKADLMLNCTLTMPYIVVLSYTVTDLINRIVQVLKGDLY